MRRSPPILERWLQLRPDERRRWLALAGFALTAGAGAAIARTATNALFLARLPIELVAWRYAAAGAAVAAALLVHWGLVGTMRRDRVAASTAVIAGASGLVIYSAIGWRPDDPSVLAAGYAWAEVFEALFVVQILDLAGAVFGPRRAGKWIGALGLTGAALGGAFVAFGRFGEITTLLWIAAALALFAAVAALDLGRNTPGGVPPDRSLAPPAPSIATDLRRMSQSRLPLAVGVAGGLAALGVTVADYLLAVTVRGLDEPTLAVFYGGFALWSAALALLVRRLLARRVLERFGVLVGLLVLPGAMAFGLAATVWTFGSLWAVTATRMAGTAFGPAATAAERVLFLPVSPDFRVRAVVLVRGLVAPAGTLLAGLALVAVPTGPGGGYALVLGLVGVLIAGAASAVATWRVYLRALSSVLRGRTRAARLRTTDQGTRLSLTAALRETRESRLLHLFELMDALEDPRAWTDASLHLLDHDSPLVRMRVLRLLARAPSRRHAERVRACLEDAHPEVRAAAIEAYCEIVRYEALGEVKARLPDPDPAVRSAVVVGLMQVGGAEGTRIAGEELRRMVIASDPRLRAAAAKVLASFYTPTLRELLLTLLADPAPDVRNAALAVAGTSGDAHLLPKLVVGLQDRRTATAAAQALSKFGHDVERDIGFALEDARRPIPTRQHLARILARMRTPLAARVLEERIGMAPVPVRHAVQASLARLAGLRGVRVDARRVDAAIADEVGAMDDWLALRRDLAGLADDTPLEEAVRLRIDRTVERVVHLLRIRWPDRSADLERALLVWRDGDPGQRLRARELLRNLLRADLRPRLMGWLEGAPKARRAPRPPAEWIDDLLRTRDEWLRVCAVHLVGTRRLAEHRAGVEDVLVDSVPELVRDAVHLALCRIDGAEPPPGDPRMFTTVEKVLYLKGVSLFARIPAEDLVAVAEIAKPVWFEPGQAVFDHGDDGDSLYLVVYGEAEVVLGDRVLATLTPGEVFGEMALLDAEPRMAAVRALVDLQTLRIGRDEFLDLVDDQPEVLKGIVKVLTTRLRSAHSA